MFKVTHYSIKIKQVYKTNTGKKQNLIRFAYLYWGVGRSSEFIFIKGILIFSLQDCHIGFLSNSLALNTGMGLFNEADTKFKFCPPGGFIPSLCQPLAFSKHKVDFKSSFDEVFWRRFFLCLLLLFFIVIDFFFLFVIVFLTFLRFSVVADSDDFIVFLGILFTGTLGLLWLRGIGMGTLDWSERRRKIDYYKVEKNAEKWVNNVCENQIKVNSFSNNK